MRNIQCCIYQPRYTAVHNDIIRHTIMQLRSLNTYIFLNQTNFTSIERITFRIGKRPPTFLALKREQWELFVRQFNEHQTKHNPDSKVHGTNIGPTWVLQAQEGTHVGPMNLAIREGIYTRQLQRNSSKCSRGIALSCIAPVILPVNRGIWFQIWLFTNVVPCSVFHLHAGYRI